MNPSVKRQLLEALRSGDYIQCFGTLRLDNNITKYCIMGVLCKLHQHDCHITKRHWRSYRPTTNSYSYMHDSALHENVAKWAGFPSTNPYLTLPDGRIRSLMYINDSLKLPFNEIADLIEEQL